MKVLENWYIYVDISFSITLLMGLSPIADLMPGGGGEGKTTVFILQGLPRCLTPSILTHFSESGINGPQKFKNEI